MHLVLFHANCRDGQVAAWSAKRHLQDTAEYIPCSHGEGIPHQVLVHRWDTVYVLDFSFHQADMAKIAEVADKVVVLDHHITAKNELTNWPNKPDNVEVVFNMEASGAYLAWWRFAATDEACPLIVAYAQDHDLWQFKLPNSRQIRAWLQTVPREGFAAVDRANDLLTDSFPMCVAVGHALEQATQERCYQIANISTAHCEGKYRVANTTSDMSEVGSYLLERFPECEVSMTYFDDLKTGTRRFSLRSRNGGFDVSELAKSLGGGGHASAAGFETYIDSRLPYEALK